MKQLQNDFTTQEQSKRLLELGVPADSANCYYNTAANKPYVLSDLYSKTIFLKPQPPCWSAGRLKEIYEICTPYKIGQFDFTGTYIEQICKAFLLAKEMILLDFSKLEE